MSEFTCQIAKQYHHLMIACHAFTCMNMRESSSGSTVGERTIMEGKYNLEVTTNGIMESNAIVLCHEVLEIYERDCNEIQNGYGYGQVTG